MPISCETVILHKAFLNVVQLYPLDETTAKRLSTFGITTLTPANKMVLVYILKSFAGATAPASCFFSVPGVQIVP